MARIMIVEDDDAIGGRLAATLRTQGHECEWCPDGASSLARAGRAPADLVLLDLGLPDADGFELCRGLRKMLPGAVLVVLTARTSEMDVIEALESGADDYLSKPFRLAELQARIAAHLRRAEPGRADGPISSATAPCSSTAPPGAASPRRARWSCGPRSSTCWSSWPPRPAAR
ncbi:response regulator transcription factor [Streptomyces decoyicus]